MGIVSYYVVPEERWLSRRHISHVLAVTEGQGVQLEKVSGESAAVEQEQQDTKVE